MTHLCAGSCGRTWAGEHGSTICLGGFVVTRRCWTCSGRRRDGRRIDGKCMTASWTCRDSWRACRRMGPVIPSCPSLPPCFRPTTAGRSSKYLSPPTAPGATASPSTAIAWDEGAMTRLSRSWLWERAGASSCGRRAVGAPGHSTSAGATFSSWAGRVSAPGSTGCPRWHTPICGSACSSARHLPRSRGNPKFFPARLAQGAGETRSRRHTPRERPAQPPPWTPVFGSPAWRDRAPAR